MCKQRLPATGLPGSETLPGPRTTCRRWQRLWHGDRPVRWRLHVRACHSAHCGWLSEPGIPLTRAPRCVCGAGLSLLDLSSRCLRRVPSRSVLLPKWCGVRAAAVQATWAKRLCTRPTPLCRPHRQVAYSDKAHFSSIAAGITYTFYNASTGKTFSPTMNGHFFLHAAVRGEVPLWRLQDLPLSTCWGTTPACLLASTPSRGPCCRCLSPGQCRAFRQQLDRVHRLLC